MGVLEIVGGLLLLALAVALAILKLISMAVRSIEACEDDHHINRGRGR